MAFEKWCEWCDERQLSGMRHNGMLEASHFASPASLSCAAADYFHDVP